METRDEAGLERSQTFPALLLGVLGPLILGAGRFCVFGGAGTERATHTGVGLRVRLL